MTGIYFRPLSRFILFYFSRPIQSAFKQSTLEISKCDFFCFKHFKILICSLGAQHDGDEVVNGVTCPAENQNVMTPAFNSQGDNYLNVYMFSQCSVTYFTNQITSLNRYVNTTFDKTSYCHRRSFLGSCGPL